jgi:hypothetical protein
LQVLEAYLVPAEALVQLTALERLSLDTTMSSEGQPTCSLSALQRLTLLHFNYAGDEDLLAIAGCTGLRSLCLTSESLFQLNLCVCVQWFNSLMISFCCLQLA